MMRLIILFSYMLAAFILSARPTTYDRTEIRAVRETQEAGEIPIKGKFTVSGRVTEKVSGEILIGASVYDTYTGKGTATNEYGFYSLTLPEGKMSLQYSHIGHEPRLITVALVGDIEQNIELNAGQHLSEVIVYGKQAESKSNTVRPGALDIPLEMIKSTPAFLGETDVLRTMQTMPGVQAGTGGSAGIHVRGGGADENLILLDGVPLYNVNHLFGFFSAFTPEAIKKVSLFKGSFPARFGGRLSSVIDVRTNDGNMHEYHGSLGIGLLSGKMQLEGPIIKGRTSFNMSARRSYADLLMKPFMSRNDNFGYHFYDLNAKVNHRFNNRSRIFISLYKGDDAMSMEYGNQGVDYESGDNTNLRWGNFLSAAKWNYQFNPKLFGNTTLAYTQYKFEVDSRHHEQSAAESYENDYNSMYSSGIDDLAFNVDFDYHPSSSHRIKFGAAYQNHQFRPEMQTARMRQNENGINTDTVYYGMSDSRIRAHETNLYFEDNLRMGKRLEADLGFHLSLFNVAGKTYASLQPRISASHAFTGDVSLKASYTQMSQYVHLLSGNTISLPTDLWVPSTAAIKPMHARQYSISGYYTGFKKFELSVEAYYKDMDNVLEYKDGTSFMGSSTGWESKVEMGKGRAMGIEFMLQRKVGKTTGWATYTLAKSDRKFAKGGINDGKRFPYKYDRRHNMNVTVNHKFSDRIDVGASWQFHTGGATTIAEEKTVIIRPDQEGFLSSEMISEANYIGSRNNYRMPISHLLNLGVNFNKKTRRGIRTWNLSIYNVYNAMNPTFIYRDMKMNGSEYGKEEKSILKKVTVLPFIPSLSYIYRF